MIELRNAAQLEKAIERAKRGRLFVQTTDRFRQYNVTNRQTGAQYNVQFMVSAGRRFATCTCMAGLNGQACKHVAAAAALHLYVAAQRVVPMQRANEEPVMLKRAPRRETFRGLPL